MSGRKAAMPPVIREAPPGELNIYRVYEHQFDLLAAGSPASLMLNFSLFFGGVAVTALGTLVTAPPNADRVFYMFFIIFLVCLIAGLVLGAIWYVTHKSVKRIVEEIKSQMPPNPAIQDELPERGA
jgi:hypothetical protein